MPAKTQWDAVYAESFDALSAHPHWTLTTVDRDVHVGPICATTGCMGNGRFAGDFLDTSFDPKDRPLIVWVRDYPATAHGAYLSGLREARRIVRASRR